MSDREDTKTPEERMVEAVNAMFGSGQHSDMSNAPKGAAAGAVELLPCPFCGSTNVHMFPPTCTERDNYNPLDRAYPKVRCQDCHGSASGRDWDHRGKSAVAAWNTRAAVQVAQRAAAASGVSPESDDGTGPLPIYSGVEKE